jgi:hypothetical protein
MKTNVYIDGFNLYYGCLKGTPHKWLNLAAFCQASFPPPRNQINPGNWNPPAGRKRGRSALCPLFPPQQKPPTM